MVKLNFPYGAGDPTPVLADDAPLVQRELPDRTKIKDVTFDPDCSHGDRDASSAKLLRVRRRTERRHAHPRVQLQRHGQNLRPGQSGTVMISSETVSRRARSSSTPRPRG